MNKKELSKIPFLKLDKMDQGVVLLIQLHFKRFFKKNNTHRKENSF